MFCFFGVISFDVWDLPYSTEVPVVARVLSSWISAKRAAVGAFVVAFTWVFLWDTDGIEVEIVAVSFGVPQDCLVTTAESPTFVVAVGVSPYDAVAEVEGRGGGHRTRGRVVEGENFVLADIVTDLPTDAPAGFEDTLDIREKACDGVSIVGYLSGMVVLLADEVRGRGDKKVDRGRVYGLEEVERVGVVKGGGDFAVCTDEVAGQMEPSERCR